jgi:3D (Asp-Asp-Asp) domain-containing protein
VIGRTFIGAATLAAGAAIAGCGDGSRGGEHHAAVLDPPVRGAPPAVVRAAPVAARTAACNPHAAPERQIGRRTWLSGFIITEYYPVPERWFDGISLRTPGTGARHRVDWLYSANGVSMEGDGIDIGGRHVHIANLGAVGWVNSGGESTAPPRCGIRWSHGPPAWRAGGWRNRAGHVTYPLAAGGWSDGAGHWVGGYGGATFAFGASLPLTYYRSVAVDPNLVPRGSRIFIPAYRGINGGWFVAQDTGGAIIGRHIDVYRPPTSQPFGTGRLLLHERVYVIPPGA